MNTMKLIQNAILICLTLCASFSFASPAIEVKGLFKNSVLLTINGKQKLLKVGRSSKEGITLKSADTKIAILDIDGQRHQVRLGQRIGTLKAKRARRTYSSDGFGSTAGLSKDASSAATVRINKTAGGHFYVPGAVNESPVKFVVDTGASVVAMDRKRAEAMGVSLVGAKLVTLHTANGRTKGYQVKLDKVTVGGITLDNVDAVVSESDQGGLVLLGNSFLSKLNMRLDQGTMILQTRVLQSQALQSQAFQSQALQSRS